MENKKEDDIGALWAKEGQYGTYYTGKVNGEPVVAFINTKKKHDRMPDIRILKARKKEEANLPEIDLDKDIIPF